MVVFSPRVNKRRGSLAMSFVGIMFMLAVLLAGCGSNTTTGSGGSSTPTTALPCPATTGNAPTPTPIPSVPPLKAPNDLITAGTLTVGSDTTYPPQEYIDPTTNQATGFDIDLIKAVAQRLGLKAKIVTTSFNTIIDSLSAKRFDVVISAVSITPQRLQKVDFVPYFNAGESLLVQSGNPMNIKCIANLCGQNVGVQNGTIEQSDLQTQSDACKKAGKPAINITALTNQTDVIQLLATNRVVATYQDSPVTDYYLKQHAGQFSVGGSVINAGAEGIVVRKGDTSMLDAMQAGFNALKTDGTYHSLIQKWGLTSEELTIIDRWTSA